MNQQNISNTVVAYHGELVRIKDGYDLSKLNMKFSIKTTRGGINGAKK